MNYRIERYGTLMDEEQLNAYCGEYGCRLVLIHDVPNYPHGRYWHYFEYEPKPEDKPKRKYVKAK